MEAELRKLEYNLGGVADMQRIPDAVIIIDLKTEEIALREAERLEIPIIGLVDTNCDPGPVSYVDPRQRRRDPLLRADHRRAGHRHRGRRRQVARGGGTSPRRGGGTEAPRGGGAQAPRGRGEGQAGGRGEGEGRSRGEGPRRGRAEATGAAAQQHRRPPSRPRPSARPGRRSPSRSPRASRHRTTRRARTRRPSVRPPSRFRSRPRSKRPKQRPSRPRPRAEVSPDGGDSRRREGPSGAHRRPDRWTCKNALEEAEGDEQKAIEILRKKGQASAAKREWQGHRGGRRRGLHAHERNR